MKIEELKRIDNSGMYKIYDKWPEIAKESYFTKINQFDVKDIDHIFLQEWEVPEQLEML